MTKDYTLVGVDGNAFAILAYVKSAMKKEGSTEEEIDKYLTRASSSDYYNLISESLEMIHYINMKKRGNHYGI